VSRFVSWSDVFGNDAPVEVEIGPGRGEMLLAYAAASPAVNFFAIERSAGRAAAIDAKATALGLRNVRVLAGDARCIVAHAIADGSVRAYHVYFPDPWPKRRHHHRRLAHGALAEHLARTLAPDGVLHVASDLPELVDELARRLVRAGLVRDPGATAAVDRPTTSFERRYAIAGTCYARFTAEAKEGRGSGARL